MLFASNNNDVSGWICLVSGIAAIYYGIFHHTAREFRLLVAAWLRKRREGIESRPPGPPLTIEQQIDALHREMETRLALVDRMPWEDAEKELVKEQIREQYRAKFAQLIGV